MSNYRSSTTRQLERSTKAVKHETVTEVESNVWERIQSLMQPLPERQRIVLGTPMWTFGLTLCSKLPKFEKQTQGLKRHAPLLSYLSTTHRNAHVDHCLSHS